MKWIVRSNYDLNNNSKSIWNIYMRTRRQWFKKNYRIKIVAICAVTLLLQNFINENLFEMESYKKIILKTINEFEGGSLLHTVANDAGGTTRYGISQRAYPKIDLTKITQDEAIEIYKQDYYDKLKLEQVLNDSLRWKIFDIAVNMGVSRACKIVQEAIGVPVDGLIGSVTLTAINYSDAELLLKKIEKLQVYHYATICRANEVQYKFLKGWNRRAFSKWS